MCTLATRIAHTPSPIQAPRWYALICASVHSLARVRMRHILQSGAPDARARQNYCKCKGCDQCRDSCMPWCSQVSDCSSEACAGCSLCAGHSHTKTCEPWCNQANCRKDACVGCDYCEDVGDRTPCSSGERNDVAFEECSTWCSETHSSTHCKMCACRSCMFCERASGQLRETGKPCPPSNDGDASTMRCEPFCRQSHADEHCTRVGMVEPCCFPPLAASGTLSRACYVLRCCTTPCAFEPHSRMSAGDLCKCKACAFCPMRLDTGVACPLHQQALPSAPEIAKASGIGPTTTSARDDASSLVSSASLTPRLSSTSAAASEDDSTTLKCEPFCAMAHARSHCAEHGIETVGPQWL